MNSKPTRIQALRVSKGLSVHDVSFDGGLDAGTVSRIERLLVRPRRSTIRQLAKGLHTSRKRVLELIEADWADKVLADHARESVG